MPVKKEWKITFKQCGHTETLAVADPPPAVHPGREPIDPGLLEGGVVTESAPPALRGGVIFETYVSTRRALWTEFVKTRAIMFGVSSFSFLERNS